MMLLSCYMQRIKLESLKYITGALLDYMVFVVLVYTKIYTPNNFFP